MVYLYLKLPLLGGIKQADGFMTLNLSVPEHDELKPRITVFGVGGAGGNAVDNMIEKQLDGVEFVVANTDAQALAQNNSGNRIQLGVKVTQGLGAGARARVGAAAAEESIEQIVDHLAGAHMCFITAGMGGGTGTGAAPIIAQAARELGVLTVGVVTKPFQFEGAKRMRQAEEGIEALQKMVDTLIIIPNQNLFRLANEKTTFTEAFSMADDVLYQGVKGVTDLMVRPGLINLDFADVRAVMDEMGKAMMGTGEAEGEERAIKAAEKAIANPLLDEISLRGARGVLINITGGEDLTLFELDEAANRIREEVDSDANIIVGSTLDERMEGVMRVSVVATGIDASEIVQDLPLPRRMSVEGEDFGHSFQETEEVAPKEAVSEPDLFKSTEPSAVGEGVTLSPSSQARPEETDQLPPPAYEESAVQEEVPSESFVAPQAPLAGTSSDQAMARLRKAVQNSPGYSDAVPGMEEDSSETERPRFGIGSLINRMSGQDSDTKSTAARKQPIAPPPSPSMRQSEPEEDGVADPEQERIEVPAFLRRQAN